jgi:hypothetical protein
VDSTPFRARNDRQFGPARFGALLAQQRRHGRASFAHVGRDANAGVIQNPKTTTSRHIPIRCRIVTVVAEGWPAMVAGVSLAEREDYLARQSLGEVRHQGGPW